MDEQASTPDDSTSHLLPGEEDKDSEKDASNSESTLLTINGSGEMPLP